MARAHALQTTEVNSTYVGSAVTHDVLDCNGQVLVTKGTLLDASAIERFPSAAPGEVHLLEMEPGDLHEDVGAVRVANAVGGDGVQVLAPAQSRVDLVAQRTGLLRVDPLLLRAINQVRDVTVYTMIDRQPVTAGTPIASAKITPIAIPETRISAVEQLCRDASGPLLQVKPFQLRRVGVLALDSVTDEQRQRFESAIQRKMVWYGASLLGFRYVAPDPNEVAEALRGLLDQGADLLLIGGGNVIDPLDPIERALEPIGARMVHRGAPTRGSMGWVARAGQVHIINVASPRMWVGNTLGDLYLPMAMAGETITPDDAMDIGYGGLPGSAVKLRFPRFEETEIGR